MKNLPKLLLALWTAAIWIGSLWPLTAPIAPGGDKLHHFVGYGVLALLAMGVFRRPLPVWLAASAMGIAVEFAQMLTPFRQFEALDMAANAAGALLGVLLMLCAQMMQRRYGR
ncbi:VanZ family protein [Chitinolyticbacter albus]|uniref:VanZ family protein n=1 Tax=Chitinolyticbacter albus TaxID=2961951 RepID=UPI00210E0A00|nr:VanZ family protein [Chitinolyticbacter albus]